MVNKSIWRGYLTVFLVFLVFLRKYKSFYGLTVYTTVMAEMTHTTFIS